MFLYLLIRSLIAAIFIASSSTIAQTLNSTSCRTGELGELISYPFGFSNSTPIRLNCENGKIRIGEFRVQNITERSILIDLPPECIRPTKSILPLFGANYWPTRNNSFLLKNCSPPIIDCVQPTSFVSDRLSLQKCGPMSDNQSCFSPNPTIGDYLDYEPSNLTRCSYLTSSIVLYSELSSTVSLAFQAVELAWWLNGTIKCDRNAYSENITLPNKEVGFRCHCKKGFEGDAYADGNGCRKAPACNASKYMSGRCGGTTRVGVLIGGIVAGAVVMASLAVICHFIRRRSSCLRSQLSAKRLLSEAAGNSTVQLYPFREIERATNSFSEKQRLGTGAFGTVYAGKLNSDEWVAIKKIKYRDHNSIDQVMNEIKLLSSVSHPNLVRLLGCCIDQGQQILVYEFMPNGTLCQHLQKERGKGLPWTIRLTIATEMAHAIAYLHSSMHPPIYHRDIKSSNILLDYHYKSKVADFGLSRLGLIETSHISTAPQGTPGYLDPQYHQNFYLSDKSDVYSFGVVLVEIITALKVVDFTRPQSEVNLAALAVDRIGRNCVDEIIDPCLEPHRDAWTLYSVHKVAELAFRCLAFHSDMRPSMMEVAKELENIRLSGRASTGENICVESSIGSSCSFLYNGNERSIGGGMMGKVVEPESWRSTVEIKDKDRGDGGLEMVGEIVDRSPVSVQDPWLSEQSSPSANGLLGNVIQ